MEEKPNLKVGVRFWRTRTGRQLRIGTRRSNFALPEQFQELPVEALLKLIDGSRTTSEIARTSGATEVAVREFIAQLGSSGLIDRYTRRARKTQPSPTNGISTATISESIGSKAIREAQLEIERNAITLSSEVVDGGYEAVRSRDEFGILIFGNSRIAVTLLGALRAAGFTRTALIDRAPRNHPSKVIQPGDLMGGIFRNSEILQNKSVILDSAFDSGLEVEADHPKGDSTTSKVKDPQLIISVGAPAFDVEQRWKSEATPHLLISAETSGEIRFGPLVRPGKTPCLTCIELSEIDGGLEPRLRPQIAEVEVSVGLAIFTAGAAILEIAKLVSGGASALLARSFEITNDRFISPESRLWQFHPLCGCRA